MGTHDDGQFTDFADELALNGYEYNKNDLENAQKFNSYIDRRNTCQKLMEEAYRVACPQPKSKTDNMMIAEDIWTEMRYQMWDDKPEPKSHSTVDSRKPLKISNEPVVKIEVYKA